MATTAPALDTTLVIALIVLLAFLYEIQRILLPFVFSGMVAYVCTPAIEWRNPLAPQLAN